MKKETRIALSFLIVLALAFFVSAARGILEYPGTSSDTEIREVTAINVEKGWNLLHGFANPDWIVSGDVLPKNIKAIYAFNPVTQEYVRFFPQPETDKISGSKFNWGYFFERNAFWVYSDASGRITYKTQELPPLNTVSLFKGWNFVGFGTHIFYDDTFAWNKVKGTCDFEKIYAWNYEDQGWIAISPDLEWFDLNDFLGMGMLVKVPSNCKLSAPAAEVIIPPALPN